MVNRRTQKSRLKWAAILLAPFVIGILVFKPGLKSSRDKQPDTANLLKVKQEKKFSAEALVKAGELIIFGTDDPKINSSGRLPVGKGQCAFCHVFVDGQNSDRCPNLINVEKRSHERIKDPRYTKESANPEIKPKAKTGGEYLIESLYCPSCYVVEGFGKAGSNDQESKMPFVTEMPMMLNDYEIVAVTSYLQAMKTPGDYARVTAKDDWERYFKKELQMGPDRRPAVLGNEDLSKTALVNDPPEVMVEKMGCFVCHKIPTVPIATTGLLGPKLILKTNAPLRLKSPEYLQAVKEGRAHATTPKEYVIESILDPKAFQVPAFRSKGGMPTNFKQKFTIGALHKLADFLLTLDEHSGEDPDLLSESGDESKETTSASKKD